MTQAMTKAARMFLVMKQLERGELISTAQVAKEYRISKRTAARLISDLGAIVPLQRIGWRWKLAQGEDQ